MNHSERSTRKSKLKRWRERENEKARARYPLSDQRLEAFFIALETLRAAHGCFHDLRHSLNVTRSMALSEADTDRLLDWCNYHGGYCDCEIAANTYMHWHSTRAY